MCLAQWVLRGTRVKRTRIQKSSGASWLNIVKAGKNGFKSCSNISRLTYLLLANILVLYLSQESV